VAHRFGLREARQADLALALHGAETRLDRLRLGKIDARHIELAAVEQQHLFMIEAAVAREGLEVGRRCRTRVGRQTSGAPLRVHGHVLRLALRNR